MIKEGEQFGNYKIHSVIGIGGMGKVYLAEDLRLNRKVALKILPATLSNNQDRLKRFEQEAFSASALNHPNILTVYDFGKQDNIYFLATEFVKGETLRDKLDAKTLNINEYLDIALQISLGLSVAHEAGIVHRDIKPENVMIREDGFVKVLDFGLAKLVEQTPLDEDTETRMQVQTQAGMIMGTVAYMSPEQARGRTVDGRTDIFSLGVVLYEMLTHRQPFTGETINHTIITILEKEPPPISQFVSDYPAEIERIIKKALAKNADARYQLAKDLLADLKALQKRLDLEAEFKFDSQSSSNLNAETQIINAEITNETLNKQPNNLSEQFTTIIGREEEIARIRNLLLRKDVRLVTMTGIGGTGKTTIANMVGHSMLMDFKDGVFFIDFSSTTQPELVASTIAQPLGVKEAGSKPFPEALKDYFKDKQLLLILDNFEQVIETAPLLSNLLAAEPQLKILVTSRSLLHLSAEREFIVPPLALPDKLTQASIDDLLKYEAIKLFIERAKAVKPSFILTNENAQSVTDICSRLDGLPLAIELAAARVKILSPQAILKRLENRLSLLTGGSRDLPARQQTMRGAVEWSYDLLNENEKCLFSRAAVFAGGFTIETAEGIINSHTFISNKKEADNELEFLNIDVLEGITSLIAKSLLVSKEMPNGDLRFRMLEVVREYALESLETSGETEKLRFNHAMYFLNLAEKAELHLKGEHSVQWLNMLEEEHDNLRTALGWFLTSHTEKAARLAGALRNFWTLHSHIAEGRNWLKATLDNLSNEPSIVRFKLLNGLGLASWYQGDYETALKMYEEGLSGGRELNDLRQIAISGNGIALVAFHRGDFNVAQELIEEGLVISRKLDDKSGISFSLSFLGDLNLIGGNTAKARPLFEEALTISKQLGYKQAVNVNLINLGAVNYVEGDYKLAQSYFTEALVAAQELGDKRIITYSLDGFAALSVRNGELKEAAKLAGAAEQLCDAMCFEIEPAERLFRDTYLQKLNNMLDKTDFSIAYEQGRSLKLEEAIALASKIKI
ncbi:MAG: protein kinase [Pyrinomonadaceae bacterium]|nr:protein kinase [Sphingobacteriaceae bacterium]